MNANRQLLAQTDREIDKLEKLIGMTTSSVSSEKPSAAIAGPNMKDILSKKQKKDKQLAQE